MTINRRRFIHRSVMGLAAWAMAPRLSGETTMKPDPKALPNILLILADDLSWCDAGCYGNREVKTPHLDGLAAQGMRFTQAFTSTAMCAPSRQQLYTGVFPVRNGAVRNHSFVKADTRSMVHHLQSLGYRVGLKGKSHVGPDKAFPFEKIRGKSRPFMKSEGPFCLVVGSHDPHLPWPEKPIHDPDQLTVPPFMVDTPETRLALARYYTDITEFDSQVGKELERLESSGKAANTIVIVTSEQGSVFPFAKWTCYDLGLRTQFIVRWPGQVKPGTQTDAMIQYVDLVPTLVEAAGGNPNTCDVGLPGAANGGGRSFDGKSFLDVLHGRTQQHHQYVYGIQTTKGINDGVPYPIRSIRDRRYKYIWNLMPDRPFQNKTIASNTSGFWKSWEDKARTEPQAAALVTAFRQRPAEEFYDLDVDPFERVNLAANPQWRTRMDAMRTELLQWMEQQGDKGIDTELHAA